MSRTKQKKRIAKDMVNFARSDKYTGADMNAYGKYQDIIDDPDRSVEEITMAALKYNWLMTVGEAIKNAVNKENHTDQNGVTLWEEKGYESVKEMSIRMTEEQGRQILDYSDPYYEEPY